MALPIYEDGCSRTKTRDKIAPIMYNTQKCSVQCSSKKDPINRKNLKIHRIHNYLPEVCIKIIIITRVPSRNKMSTQHWLNASQVRHSPNTRPQPRACQEQMSERSQVNLSYMYKKLENKTYTIKTGIIHTQNDIIY